MTHSADRAHNRIKDMDDPSFEEIKGIIEEEFSVSELVVRAKNEVASHPDTAVQEAGDKWFMNAIPNEAREDLDPYKFDNLRERLLKPVRDELINS